MKYYIVLHTKDGLFFYSNELRQIQKTRKTVKQLLELPFLKSDDIIYIFDLKESFKVENKDKYLKNIETHKKRFIGLKHKD